MATGGSGLTEEQKKEGERAELRADNIHLENSVLVQDSENTKITMLPIKCWSNSGRHVREKIKKKIRENSLPEDIVELLNDCDAILTDVVEGCVKLLLGFRSVEGLTKFWEKYSSGEIQERLGRELGIGEIKISEEDYCRALEILEVARIEKESLKKKLSQKWDAFEKAAEEYVGAREKTISILESLAIKIEEAHRGKNRAKVAAGLIAAGVIVGGLAAAPFSGGTSLGASLLQAGSALVAGGLIVTGAWGLTASVIPLMAQWLTESRAMVIVQKDVKATQNFKRAFDELNSAWSELKAFGTSDVNRPSAFRVESTSHLLFDVAAVPELRHRVRDPTAELSVVGIPANFEEVIAPAIIYQRRRLSEVVGALRNVVHAIKGPSEEEIHTLLDDIRSHMVN